MAPTKATNNIKILKQPAGTNHFQFRVQQLERGVRGTAGFCSMERFYFSPEALCNHSFKDQDNNIIDARSEARWGSSTFGVKRIPTADEHSGGYCCCRTYAT